MSTRLRTAGEFCWINVLTPEPEKARKFFGTVLGWTYSEMGTMGHLIMVGNSKIGGIFDVVSPQTPKGAKPVIGVMVKVEDADATAKKIQSLGGATKPPMDLGESGRMVVAHDPLGAQFDLWQPKKQPGTDVDGETHGAPSWFETITTDVPRASQFYSSLFGWKPNVTKLADGREYTDFMLDQTPVAGLLAIREGMGNASPHWDTYFTVRDVAASAKEATKLGAKIFMPMMDIPTVGRMCGVTSPQGVAFYMITYTMKS
jgi:predicted enzyme related to lactoylglutathione lyase